jgi:hypothetical protein
MRIVLGYFVFSTMWLLWLEDQLQEVSTLLNERSTDFLFVIITSIALFFALRRVEIDAK